ncbi:hypothetical protein C8R44DRAFT_301348 [Mycena epipterygia]|nr:hypothetical protein C8R44DRAFT_301348 [Mycena epipterygia]
MASKTSRYMGSSLKRSRSAIMPSGSGTTRDHVEEQHRPISVATTFLRALGAPSGREPLPHRTACRDGKPDVHLALVRRRTPAARVLIRSPSGAASCAAPHCLPPLVRYVAPAVLSGGSPLSSFFYRVAHQDHRAGLPLAEHIRTLVLLDPDIGFLVSFTTGLLFSGGLSYLARSPLDSFFAELHIDQDRRGP